jgi:aminoglycoside phosphotransferase (APT) family kinase protein
MDLALEKKKLDAIKPYITLPIPQYTIVDNTFITYPAIKGTPFDDCDLPYDDEILESLAGFLKELHSVPLEHLDFMQSPKEQTEEEKNEFYKRVQSLKQDV